MPTKSTISALPCRRELTSIYTSFSEFGNVAVTLLLMTKKISDELRYLVSAKINASGRFVRDSRVQTKNTFGWGHYHQNMVSSDTYHQEAAKLRAMGYLPALK